MLVAEYALARNASRVMSATDLDLLPAALAARSYDPREIVLPYQDALAAVAHLGGSGVRLLGWEGWLAHPDGALGHAPEQGTVSLDGLSLADAAAVCARTIRDAERRWASEHPDRAGALLFCISVAAS